MKNAPGMRLLEFERYEIAPAALERYRTSVGAGGAFGLPPPAPMARCLGPVTFDADEIVEIGRGAFQQSAQHYLATVRVRGDMTRVQVACEYEEAIQRWKVAKAHGVDVVTAPLPAGWEVDHDNAGEMMLRRNDYCEAVRDVQRGWISPGRNGVFLAPFKWPPAAVAQMVDGLWPSGAKERA